MYTYWLIKTQTYLCNLTFKKTECSKKLSPYRLALAILDDWRRTSGQTILKLTVVNAVYGRNFRTFNPENSELAHLYTHTHTQPYTPQFRNFFLYFTDSETGL